MHLRLTLSLLLLVGACGASDDRRDAAASSTATAEVPSTSAPMAASAPAVVESPRSWEVTLVDSVAYDTEMASGVLHHVRVATPDGVDTLNGILTRMPPVVVDDSTVVGLRAEEDRIVGLFAYDRRTRRTRVIAPPVGWLAYSSPSLAPDGRHVAYMGVDERGRGFSALATVLEGMVLFRGPPVTLLETDAGVDQVAWLDATHFEVRIALTATTGGEQRTRGALDPLVTRIDTVRATR